MNLRLSAESVRFRLSRDEFSRLLQEGFFEEKVFFPGGGEFLYSVEVSKDSLQGEPSLMFEANRLKLFASRQSLEDLAGAPRSQNSGLRSEIRVDENRSLRVSLEIDLFKESKRAEQKTAWAVGLCVLGFVLQSATGCSLARIKKEQTVQASPAPAQEETLPIIDAHTHTSFTGKPEPTTQIPMTLEEYLKAMKEAGVVGAISHVNRGGKGYVNLKQYGVIHCAAIGSTVDAHELEAGLKSGKYGCMKIYLGYIHQYASDPRYKPAYQLAEKYDVPVVFHTGDTYSIKGKLKYADPLTIDEVAVDYPRVRFVIAHCGNPWIESAAEVAYKNPNVWLDGSALLIGDMAELPPEQVQQYVVRPLAWIFGYVENPKKLLFGSDWPLNNVASYVSAFKQAIPRQHWKAVFHDNAAEVFKLK